MNDNFDLRRILGYQVDEQRLKDTIDYLNSIIKDLKPTSNVLTSFTVSNREMSFSDNKEQFNEETEAFLDYVRKCVQSDEFAMLYILRVGNTITYGRYKEGIKVERFTIAMTSDEDLRTLYELLKTEFADELTKGSKHTFGKGWSLLSTIRNIMIDIDSYESSDRNWFYDESHKKPNKDVPMKKQI